ncbi:hypothetical protein JAO29_18155 [Edaphobacter sp. HDX4]|uniref:hypothetical protein n=1 Tax=Edaphobacter sp. HDX4 TaxID=2794064 RepID=UPI002FE68826
MKLLGNEEITEWCATRGISRRGRKLLPGEMFERWIVVEVPESANARMALAIDLVLLGGDINDGDFVWVSDWDRWGELNRELGETVITRLRVVDSEPRIASLAEKPGLLSGSEDRSVLAAIIWQVMLFGWDTYLIPSAGSHVVEYSHDDLVWISYRDSSRERSMLDALARWGAKVKRPASQTQ